MGRTAAPANEVRSLALPRLVPNDTLTTIALFALAFATRLPFRTHLLFNWDAANFAFALDDFDVTQHRPHPPGYPLFVLSGWLVRQVVQDANLALVLVSMTLNAAAVAATYWAGVRLFSRPVGTAAALLLLTSVTFWTYGAVALAYSALALASALALGITAPPLYRSAPLAMSLLIGISSGFRPDLFLWLGPLWAWTLIRSGLRLALPAAMLAGLLVLGWLVPTIALSGGLDAYIAVMRAYIGIDVVERYAVVGQGTSGLITNIRDTASYLVYALFAAAIPLALAAVVGLRRWQAILSGSRLPAFVLLLAPSALFLPLIHVGDPGYVFVVLPPVLLLASQGILHDPSLPRWLPHWQALALLALILVANSFIFLDRKRPLTAWGLRQHDQDFGAAVKVLRECCPPAATVILSYESFKLAQYYLPEYPWILYSDITSAQSQGLDLRSEVNRIVFFDGSVSSRTRPYSGVRYELLVGSNKWSTPVYDYYRHLVYGPQIYLER